MSATIDISMTPIDDQGRGGGGPEDDPRFPGNRLRSHGLLTLTFGFAVGFGLFILAILILIFQPHGTLVSTFKLGYNDVYTSLFFWFLGGFIGGTIIAGIYNLLVVRRLNLFGLESMRD